MEPDAQPGKAWLVSQSETSPAVGVAKPEAYDNQSGREESSFP